MSCAYVTLATLCIWLKCLQRGGPANLDERADSFAAPGSTGPTGAAAQGDSQYFNSEGVAKPVVVKRSCTEAMLKVRKVHSGVERREFWCPTAELAVVLEAGTRSGQGGPAALVVGKSGGSVQGGRFPIA